MSRDIKRISRVTIKWRKKKIKTDNIEALFHEESVFSTCELFDVNYNNNHLPVKQYKIKFIIKIEILKYI